MKLDELLEGSTLRTPRVDVEEALHQVRSLHASSRRHRRARITAVAAAVVVVTLVAGFLGAGPNDDDRTEVATDKVAEGVDADRVPGWEELPDAPIDSRTGVAAVATDDEFFVWGGHSDGAAHEVFSDGAAYSFDDATWRSVSNSALGARQEAVTVWTGTHVVVWGGAGSETAPAYFYDGAAWDPETDTWTPYEQFAGALASTTAAVWTGDEAVLVGVNARPNELLPSDTYAFDPATGEWRALDPYPHAEDAPVESRKAFFTDHGVLVVTVTTEAVTVARLDPDTGQWHESVSVEMSSDDVTADAAAWTGSAVVIANRTKNGLALFPDSWSTVPLPPSESELAYPAAAVTDSIVSVGDRWIDTRTLTSGSAEWHASNLSPDSALSPAVVVHDDRLYAWGGWRCPDNARCVTARPGTGAVWTPPSPDGSTPQDSELDEPATATDPAAGAVDGPHIGHEQESAKDLAERFMADVVGDPSVAMSATDTDRRTTVVRLETSTGTVVDATVIADPRRQRLVLEAVRSPGLTFEPSDRTIAVPGAGSLVVIGYDGGFTGDGEVMVDELTIEQAGTVGPLDLVESSWLRVDFRATDGRTLYLIQARG